MSRMNRYRPDVSFPTNVMSGTYYLPQISEETVPAGHFKNKCSKLVSFYKLLGQDLQTQQHVISTQTASNLDVIPGESVDYTWIMHTISFPSAGRLG